MPKGLIRHQHTGDLHFITISCYRHTHVLETPAARDTLQRIVEETRQKYLFHVLGYVFLSNHIHLLVTEPETANLSTAIQVLKQRFSRIRSEELVWDPDTTTSTSSPTQSESRSFVTCTATLSKLAWSNYRNNGVGAVTARTPLKKTTQSKSQPNARKTPGAPYLDSEMWASSEARPLSSNLARRQKASAPVKRQICFYLEELYRDHLE